MDRVIIVIEGGLITNIYCEEPEDLCVVVVDWDAGDSGETPETDDRVHAIPDEDGGEDYAWISFPDVLSDTELDEPVLAAINRVEDSGEIYS